MDKETAFTLIDRVFNFCSEGSEISFVFQGGEPTLAGKDFYRNFAEYAEKNNSKSFSLKYSVQTNAFTVDGEWCEIFKKHNFLVGVSLDGGSDINDLNRTDKSGNGSYGRVMKSIKLLKKAGVEFNILSVITKASARRPKAVFEFYRKNGFKYVQLIPCLDPLSGEKNPYSLSAEDYAAFMKSFFSLWYEELKKNNYISVRLFDNLISVINGHKPEQCGALGFCTLQFVAEADGSIYPCDFFVLDKYKMGNVKENTVAEIAESDGAKAFLSDEAPQNSLCGECRYISLCGGGCKRYRPLYNQKEGYCPYKDFLAYSSEKLINASRFFR